MAVATSLERSLTTAEVARLLSATEEWVRDHAAELGAFRLGRSPRAPLRFEPEQIAAYKERQRLAPLEQPAPAPRPRRRNPQRAAPPGVELLPLP